MATAWRKVKREQDFNVTIADMLSIYRGESDYAKYDHSTSQWNLFLKDFHADNISQEYTNKLKVAAILWNIVKNSKGEKNYRRAVVEENREKIMQYLK